MQGVGVEDKKFEEKRGGGMGEEITKIELVFNKTEQNRGIDLG